MSDPARKDIPPQYETPIGSNPSIVPVSSVPITSFLSNSSPPPPTYYATPSGQVRNFPTVAPQWSHATIIPQNPDRSAPFFQTFIKGKPKALGIVVICAAILEIALGIGLIFTTFVITPISGIPFWGSVFYIIAGSLTVAAQTKPNVCLIRGSLSLNILSSLFSMTAIILNAVDLVFIYCYYDYSYEDDEKCLSGLRGGYAVLSLLIVINLLLFCVTIFTSIYGCRSLSKVQSVPQVIVIQNDVVHPTSLGAVPVTATHVDPPPLLAPPQYSVTEVTN